MGLGGFWLFISLVIGFLVSFLNFSGEVFSGKPSLSQVKRGYVFDRNFEPIAITTETYKVYYVKKDRWFEGDIPSEIKFYLASTLNLPKRGLIPLGENLTSDEVEKLKNKKDVFIEKNYRRKLLVPELDFLIGEVFNGHGVSGIEKVFDETLRKGDPVVLSIDLKLERRLIELKNFFEKNEILFGGAIIHVNTGEIRTYVDIGEKGLFQSYFSPSNFGLSLSQALPVNIILETPTLHDKNVNLWYLAESLIREICGNYVGLTLLRVEEKRCLAGSENEKRDLKKMYFLEDGLVKVYVKNDKLFIMRLKFKEKSFSDKGRILEKIDELLTKLI